MESRARILLVEDEPYLIELVKVLLETHGYRVDVLARGDQVLETVRSGPPDLILLDIMLPKLNGLEVCRQLKGDPDLKRVPIIILSALVQKGEIELGIRMGADLYMTKPFKNAELLANIGKLLGERK